MNKNTTTSASSFSSSSSSSSTTTSSIVRRKPTALAYAYVLSDEKISDRLKCAVCHEPFIRPVALPCKHVFCMNCISPLVQLAGGDQFPCPTCRKNTLINDINEADSTLHCLFCGSCDSSTVVNHFTTLPNM